MRRNNDISVLPPALGLPPAAQVPQPDPRPPGPLLEGLDAGRPRRTGAGLVVPPRGDEAQVGPGAELGREHRGLGPRVAGERRHLLDERLRDDFQAGVDGRAERLLAGLQGAPHRRGHEVGEPVVVREGRAQGGALLRALGGQVRVWDLLVDHGEVVEALRVADEVNGDGHAGLALSSGTGFVQLLSDLTWWLVRL